MNMPKPLFKILQILATIGALVVPCMLVSGLLEFSEFTENSKILSSLVQFMKLLSIPGLLFILVMLWRSGETSNEKQYYTILSVIFFGIPLSLYWFSKGINSTWNKETKEDEASPNPLNQPTE
jgi:L-asparagine transporter-like permease